MRSILCLVALLSIPRPAAAASLTIDNLWELPVTFIAMWATPTPGFDIELVSADYGIKPTNFLDIAITKAAPLAGFASMTVALPDILSAGFIWGGLTVGGTCPQNCGWSAGGELYPGDVISGTEQSIINVLWPTTDPSYFAPIVRLTYTPSPPTQTTPEPASGLLLLIGIAVLWRHQYTAPVARSTWPKRKAVSMM